MTPYEDDPPTLKRLHPDLRQPPQALPIAASLLAMAILMALAWVVKHWVLR